MKSIQEVKKLIKKDELIYDDSFYENENEKNFIYDLTQTDDANEFYPIN